MLAGISSSLTHQIAGHGVYATFVLMAIDAVFPAASELVMLVAGALAAGAFATKVDLFGATVSSHSAALAVMGLAGTLGYFVGSIAGWWIGRAGGRPLLEQHGRWFQIDDRQLVRAERWFERWGQPGVLLGRIVPVVRSFISIPAGVFEMPLAPYAFLTLVGSAIWAFAFAGIGYVLGTRYAHFDHLFRYAEYAVVFVVLALVARTVIHLRRNQKRDVGAASAVESE